MAYEAFGHAFQGVELGECDMEIKMEPFVDFASNFQLLSMGRAL